MSQTRVTVKDQNIAVVSISKGFIGPPGRAATATAGTTTTGAAGTNASVTNVGTLFDSVFDFVIPKGDTGDAATIAVGTVTALTPDQNPTVINSGTSGAAVLDFGLPTASTIDLGVVTIVNPDQNPSITDVGVSGDVVLDINIPRAADVTVQPAVTLTPDQSPSVADNGTNGDVDLTFSIPRAAAVNVNAVTTVNPNVNPSVADTGINGDVDLTFSIPRAAALDLGTITVVTPDQNPSITDVGTNGDAEFNFSLPRAATITLEPTTVLTPNQNPSVADTGTNGDAVYTFSIPRASVVSLGTVSVLNPDQNPVVTSTVVSGDIAYNFAIPRAADVSVGTVTTGAPGSQATVSNTGANGDVELNFSIPEGEKGDQGDAATLNLGTVSVVNPDQNPGITNSGTQSDAVFDFNLPRASDVSLGSITVVNPDQNPAITDVGINGDVLLNVDLPRAPDFTVGSVTTGNAGTNVIITDVGTNGDIALNFTIPRGDKGDTGEALKILGTLPDVGSLPAIGNEGDAYIIDGDLYVWSAQSNAWLNVGSISGPGVALGGTTNQILTKLSNDDFDTQWVSDIDVASVTQDKAVFNIPLTEFTAPAQGEMQWNLDEGTLELGLDGGCALQVGQETLYYVKNQTGSTITNGTLVVASGTLGNSGRILITPWTGTQPVQTIMGLTTENIATGEDGYVTHFGKVRDIDTTGTPYSETWANGDILYAGPSGGLTNVKPAAPDTKTIIALVINSAVDGTLFVRPTLSSSIGDDDLIELSTLSDNDILRYNSANGRFENESLGTAADADTGDFATSAQGSLADTALQPADVGTAAAANTEDFATAAQGSLADTAVQPNDNVSTLTNDANYIDAAGAPVQSVNTQTGSVILDTDDIAEGLVNEYWKEAPSDGSQYARQDGAWTQVVIPPDAVTSVNGQTGVVVLDSADVGAEPAFVTLPVSKGGTGATTHTAGNVLIGNGTGAVTTASRSGIDTRSTFPPSAHTHVSTDITDFETAVQSASPAPNNPTITIDAGNAIDGGGTFTLDQANAATITLDHADTSSQASVSNSSNTVIQSVSLDGFGHVTNLASKTLTSSDVGAEPSFSTLAVNKGGTGRTTHTAGNVLLGNGTGGFNSVSRSGVDTRSTFPPSAHNHTTANITSGTFSVARGGTGRSTLTNNTVLVGNGTSAVSMLSRSGIDTRTSFPAAIPTTLHAIGTYAMLTISDLFLTGTANISQGTLLSSGSPISGLSSDWELHVPSLYHVNDFVSFIERVTSFTTFTPVAGTWRVMHASGPLFADANGSRVALFLAVRVS